jgi:hypothetical protein
MMIDVHPTHPKSSFVGWAGGGGGAFPAATGLYLCVTSSYFRLRNS